MSLFHKNKKNVKHGIKKVDAIITGLVLGGIVASVYGIKKHEQGKNAEEKADKEDTSEKQPILKSLLFGYRNDTEKATPKEIYKPSLIRRILAAPFILSKKLGKK